MYKNIDNLRKLLTVFIGLIFTIPVLAALLGSLQISGVIQPVILNPDKLMLQWENYRRVFDLIPLRRYLANSMLVVLMAVPVTLFTSAAAGFALTQMVESSRSKILYISFVMMVIPAAAVWLLRFHILFWLGLLDSLWALILPAFGAGSPLFVLLFYWNFRQIPSELFDSARLDGASALKMLWSLALPLSLPTIVGVVVLSFMMFWGDFVSPVLYIFDPEKYTVPIGVQLLNQIGSTDYPLLMAGSVVMMLPVLILFVFLQHFFLHRLAIGTLYEKN